MSDKKARIESLVDKALSLFSGDGRLINEDITKFSQITYILGDLYMSSAKWVNNAEKRIVIANTLLSLRTKKRKNFTAFNKTIQAQVRNAKKKNRKKHYLLFTLNLPDANSSIFCDDQLTGNHMDIVNFSYLNQKIDWNRKELKVEFPDIDSRQYFYKSLWLKLPCYGLDAEMAINSGMSYIESFRSLANFILTFNKITYQSHPMQLSPISPSKYYFLLDEKEQYVRYKWTLGDFSYKQKRLAQYECKNIIKFIKEINSIPESELKRALLACFNLYCNSMDSNRRDYSFLVLWTIVDILTRDIKNNTKYLKNIYKKQYEDVRLVIDALFNKRNLLVHQGKIDDFDIDDVNWLKIVVKDLLWFAMLVAKDFSRPDDLKMILQKADLDPKQIEKEKKALNFIANIKAPI